MGKYSGKRLLLLGTSAGSIDIVKYVKSEGAYVIVTDNLPPEKSEAKQFADESAMVSTFNVDELCKLALNKKVDGVFCGISEPILEINCKICQKLGLPFYFSQKQWDVCQNKRRFKDTCIHYKVPIVPDYMVESENSCNLQPDCFPVIVKPTDACAARGVSVCYNNSELSDAIIKAKEHSPSKTYVVEKYLTCDDIVVFYTAQNGNYSISAICDRYMNKEQYGVAPQPVAHVYPSKYKKLWMDTVDKYIKDMFHGLEIINGDIILQAFVNDDEIYLFEMGYRLNGAFEYKIVEHENGINVLKMLADYSITGKFDLYDSLKMNNPNFKHYYVTLSFLLKNGFIANVSGFDEMKKHKNVFDYYQPYHQGDTMKAAGTYAQIYGKYFLCAETIDEMKDAINDIISNVEILDENGNSLLLNTFDAGILNNYQ